MSANSLPARGLRVLRGALSGHNPDRAADSFFSALAAFEAMEEHRAAVPVWAPARERVATDAPARLRERR